MLTIWIYDGVRTENVLVHALFDFGGGSFVYHDVRLVVGGSLG
jgi:hypothetical protein